MNGHSGKRMYQRLLRVLAVFAVSLAVVLGMLLCVKPTEALGGIKALLLDGFLSEAGFSRTMLFWPLLMLTGLSVGCAWKAGFLHLGAPGQFTLGAFAAMSGGLLLKLPWWACLMLAAFGGMLGGAILGLIKHRSWMIEVLSAVMLNYTALYLTQWLWEDGLSAVAENASLNHSAVPVFMLGNQFAVSLGLPIALLLCLVLWIVLRFTVIGFEVQAGSANQEAARRAGMPVERNRKRLLVLSGAFSGLAGGVCLLSGMTDTALSVISVQMGFAGLTVALLSFAHPIGIIVAALVAAGILAGGETLPATIPQEIGMMLLALALLGSAIMLGKKQKEK